MGPRKKRAGEEEIFEVNKVALAAGGSSGGSGHGSSGGGFTPGQSLSCQVIRREPGGFAVCVGKEKLNGFLPTQTELKIASNVIATYVCIHNGRVLVAAI